eukprot:TRINITY_DN68549_c0_g1_i1.p1 TRINITY_DN68549_c0_g1~~TRINITY_DN68549_c0_g1_i1.p1  ORF type:complete len:222 (+),score=64.79 TRINITY_DN68549_c0_g1_i1:183-848(+)
MLHPYSRVLYRDFMELGRQHPTMSLDEIRHIVKLEFYRRGGSRDKEHIQRALAYGRKQLRHLRNGIAAYNSSRGGALPDQWKLLNDGLAHHAQVSFDAKVRYVPRRSLINNFRESIPAPVRHARLTPLQREQMGLISAPPTSLPLIEAPTAENTRINREQYEIKSFGLHDDKNKKRVHRFAPRMSTPFGAESLPNASGAFLDEAGNEVEEEGETAVQGSSA